MNKVKVYLNNGTSYLTEVSARSTKESCEEYFVGKWFNNGIENDKMIKCIAIDFIKAA